MVKAQGAIPAIGDGGIFNGGGAEFECRRAADRRVSVAGDIAVDGDVAAVHPQMAGIVDPAFDDEPAAPGGLQCAGVVDDVASRIDHERVITVGENRPLIDAPQK